MTRFALLLALLFVCSAPARAEVIHMGLPEKPYKPGIPDTTVTIEVTPLSAGVYAAKISYVWTGWVELPDGILVIDTGFSEAAGQALADTIRARSGKRPIRYVVNTHDHGDHTGGNRFFGALGATFIAHANAAPEIQHDLTWTPGERGDTLTHSGITPKVIAIRKRASYGNAKRPVQVISLGHPAHTAGDLVVYLPKQKILFAGDLATNRAVPWLLDSGMSVEGWLQSLDTLLTPAFTIEKLVPGHGVLPAQPVEAIRFTDHYIRDAQKKASEVAGWGTGLSAVREWGYLGAYEDAEFYDQIHFMNMKRLYNEAKGIKTPGRKNAHVLKRS